MTTFPALVPSSRTFTPGEYPATAFGGYSGAQNRVRHSNVFLAAQLRLTFTGLSQAQMLDIWNHYNGRRGEFRSFALPAEVVSYGGITDYVPGTYLWRYDGAGSVEDLPCGGHNVSLTLETVPPSAASVIGAQLFAAIQLTTGAANGGEYELGISESLTFSIQTESAFAALDGLNQTLALSLESGAAAGDVETEGVDLFLFMDLLNSVGVNEGRNGIDETINLSLAAGTANENAGGTDPDFASVSLLLHMDGSNGSTTFTDSSSNGLTVTANDNAQVSTAQSKFGGSSAWMDGPEGCLLVTSDTSLDLPGDFTIEFWHYITSITAAGFFGRVNTGGYNAVALDVTGGVYRLRASSNGTSHGLAVTFTGNAPTANTWQHVAVTREGNVWRLFRDGAQIGTTTNALTPYASTDPLVIGARTATDNSLEGYIDEFRVTKGVARYTANFTPPTGPFPDS